LFFLGASPTDFVVVLKIRFFFLSGGKSSRKKRVGQTVGGTEDLRG